MDELFKENITAIIPFYTENKCNYTIIHTDKGQEIIEKNIKSVMNNLCKLYHYDLKASNKTYGELFCIKRNPPIPISYDMIFIPVKIRKPEERNDGAYAYIKLSAIDKLIENKRSKRDPKIKLTNGVIIQTNCNGNTIRKNIQYGRIIKKLTVNSPYKFIDLDDFNSYDANNISLDADVFKAIINLFLNRGVEGYYC